MRYGFSILLCIGLSGLGLLEGCAPSRGPARARADLGQEIGALAAKIAAEMAERGKKRIAVIEFTDSEGRRTPFGTFLSERLLTELYRTGRFELVERSQLDKVMTEHQLNLFGIIDPASAKALDRILGVDGIVTGSVADLGSVVGVNARLIGTETGVIFAAVSSEIPKDEKIQRLLAAGEDRPPLEIHMNLLAEREIEGPYEEIVVHEGGVLNSGDHLKVHFSTNQNCYVCVLIYDSGGEAHQLFPDPKIRMNNRVVAGKEYTIPPENLWFRLDQRAGIETIYLLASYASMGNLDALLKEMERVGAVAALGRSKAISQLDHKVYAFVTRGAKDKEKQKEKEKKKKKEKQEKKKEKRKKPRKPKRPIGIAGVVRGIEGIVEGRKKTYTLQDGTRIEKITEIVKGEDAVVRAISFYHR